MTGIKKYGDIVIIRFYQIIMREIIKQSILFETTLEDGKEI